MGTIQQKFTGDASQLEAEYAKILAQQIKLEEQLNRVKRAADKAGDSQVGFYDRAMKGSAQVIPAITAVTASYMGVSTAIDMINDSLRTKAELEAKNLKTSMIKADAEAQVSINMGDVTDKEFQGFLGRIGDIGKATGFQSEVPLMMAAATTLSAVAGDTERTADTLKTLAPIFKSTPDDLSEVAQVVGSLGKMTEANARETTGLVLSTMGQARITSLQAFKNVGPALSGSVATQKNIDPKIAAREAAAAFAGIGSLIDDAQGDQTKTAVANLSANLEKAFPRNEELFRAAMARGATFDQATKESALSFAQRLDIAQGMGDKIQEALSRGQAPDSQMVGVLDELTKTGFEGAVRPVIKELVSGNDSRAARGFDAALGKIGFDGGFTDRLTNRLTGGTLNLALANQQREFEGVVERGLSVPEFSIKGQSRDIFEKALDNIGMAGWARTLTKLENQYTGDDEAGFARTLELEERRIRSRGFLGPLRSSRTDGELTEGERAQVGVLRGAMDAIRQNMERNQRRNNAALQNQAQHESQ